MNILIIGDVFTYPNGYGATARVHALARGLKYAGAEVRVLVTTAVESMKNPLNREIKGVYKGIPFEYTAGQTTRASSFWFRRLIQIRSIYKIIRIIRGFKKRELDAVLFFSVSSVVLPFVVGPICKQRGAVLLYDGCEYPFIYQNNTIPRKLFKYFYINFVYKIYDGIFSISSYLEGAFGKWIKAKAKIIKIPILIDLDDFRICDEASSNVFPPKIVYAGNLDHRDEIGMLIRTYAAIVSQYHNIKLQIIGDSTDDNIADYRNEIRMLNLGNNVEFTGMLGRNEIIRQLANASILVLFRSRGIFSMAGFPTKLGEYLVTGKPVIITDNGDISIFLKSNFNAFLVPPDDNEKILNCLKYVLDNPVEARKVGEQGRKTAIKYFDCRLHGHRLLKFIEYLKNIN